MACKDPACVTCALDAERAPPRPRGRPRSPTSRDALRPALRKWAAAVIERDGACQRCGATTALTAHHLTPRSEAPERQFDLQNGITLCRACHAQEHPNMPPRIGSVKA